MTTNKAAKILMPVFFEKYAFMTPWATDKHPTESFCAFLEENEHSGFHCFAGGRSAVSKPASSIVLAGSAALNPIAKKYYKTLLKRSK